ncbi:MAG: toll/interleukin-1 receptor domain-containing protein [Kineosporiaceae bacterium]
MKVFVSYRRADVSGYSGRLTDALSVRLGAENVFHDTTAIAPGRDFRSEIDQSLDASDAVLAMIGPGWLTAVTPDGERRLFQPNDVVRAELSRALSKNVTVVPVLVGGASLPAAGDLPPDLVALTERQAFVVRDESFHADIDRLLHSLRGEPVASPMSSRRRPALAAAIVVVVLCAAGLTWWVRHDRTAASENGAPTGCPSSTSGTWTDIALAAQPTASLTHSSGAALTFRVNAAQWRQESAGHWLVVVNTQMENGASTGVTHEAGMYSRIRVARRDVDLYCFDSPGRDTEPSAISDARAGFNVTCKPDGAMSLMLQDSKGDLTELPFTATSTPAVCLTGQT